MTQGFYLMSRLISILMKVFYKEITGKVFLLLIFLFILPVITGGDNNNQIHFSIRNNVISLLDSDGKVAAELSLEKEIVFGYAFDDSTGYLFCILGTDGDSYGKRIAVYRLKAGEIREIYYGEERYNPWKVLLADVDGDRQIDICVGVWKKTFFDPEYDNRLFVYDWDDERLFPKWLGSRLSSPFEDYDFSDIDGDGKIELIALEIQQNGLKRVMSYKWQSFGFTGFEVLYKDQTVKKLSEINLGREKMK